MFYHPKLCAVLVVNYTKNAKTLFNYLHNYTKMNVVELPLSYCKTELNCKFIYI